MSPRIADVVDRARAAVHRGLSEAPLGGFALLEASLAWQHHRNGTGSRSRPASEHRPVLRAADRGVAARVARQLAELASASVVPDTVGTRVEVVGAQYHRVVRALGSTWRSTRRQFAPGSAADPTDVGAAVALWRMGLLLAGP